MKVETKREGIGTPLSPSATKVLFLGAGELGKEVIIELQRFGVEVIAVDRYANAPGMQVAHRAHVISMTDEQALRELIKLENPTYIVPEIEAIATHVLLDFEQQGYTVIPTARAVQLTMDREGIRRLAAETLQVPTSAYCFAHNEQEYKKAVETIGLPCVVKPSMSSSGKGQTIVRSAQDIPLGWLNAGAEGRAQTGKVIVEQFVPFDYEITLLTVRAQQGTLFCEPIGHKQIDGDYRESWQPHPMTPEALAKAQHIAKTITDELGGYGIFGVELFVCGDDVLFSEVSPRPHDTGLVTLISQNLSEFSLHARAILGLPIGEIEQCGPAASSALLVSGDSDRVRYHVAQALQQPKTDVRLFGKPEVHGERRMGVALARDKTIEKAREKACKVRDSILIEL